MKKHLIAAAVAGALAVPAMAEVTISGNLNIAPFQNQETVTTTASGATTVKLSNALRSAGLTTEGWTASQLAFSGTEDLGGGLKASFIVASRLNNTATAGNAIWGGRDTNIALSGGFGTFRFGRFIPATAGYHGFTGARTTNQNGHLYGGIISAGTANFGNAADTAHFERQASLLQYTSPSIGGLSVNVAYSGLGSDDDTATTATGNADSTLTGISASYDAGPLKIGIGMNNIDTNTEGTTATATARDSDLNWFGVSYNFGVATVTAAQVRREASLATGTAAALVQSDVTLNSIGVSVPMGAITIGASTYSGDNAGLAATTDDLDLKGYQLSVTYALSKRTTVYAAMGENETKRAGTNTTGAIVEASSNAIGVMHSF